MFEVRWHGRGGQGAWTASNLLAISALKEGKYTQSFPTFGPERMGAPIMAFTRVSDEPIEIHCGIYNPDAVIVLDPTLLRSVPVLEGLKEGGLIIANYRGTPEELAETLGIKGKGYQVYVVPATDIAVEILGRGITNTAMLGALVKATGIVKLESIYEALKERFPGKIAELNVKVVEKSYKETRGKKL
ncbi:MAG: pyruvate synthase subunit porC [Candidatus Methanomethylicota archaeon]|uniref:pyruvate synthase n=1 Tax=Thermoproteota archaeon TaxID=2056631 RepID=A0A497EX50_9CREN|nr:MAG: pyruvate synthase subunit porC [Candidatus Verstraetearchaeota archaeon]RLE53051.1 MAG: pyruvate synthase subunit porC [Candidatus Verstraetearchaeota archaeon]